MAFEIFHEVPIEAQTNEIYRALTDENLISEWWLPGSKVDSQVGGVGVFPLTDGKNKITVRVKELIPGQRVVWECLEHKFPEWSGTVISFEILPETLRFRHSGWKDNSGVFGRTSFFWAATYLSRLQDMLELR